MHLRHISPRSSDWMDAMDEEAGGRGWGRLAPEEQEKLLRERRGQEVSQDGSQDGSHNGSQDGGHDGPLDVAAPGGGEAAQGLALLSASK